jgi:uncharacterized protein (DUF433 family)
LETVRIELRRAPEGGTSVLISSAVDRRAAEAIQEFIEKMNQLEIEIVPSHSGSSGDMVVLVWDLKTKGSPVESTTTSPIANGPVETGIEATPGVCGGEPRIAGTRIPVWTLVQSRRLGMSDAEILRAYPHLRNADLVNAWAYAAAHAEEIDNQIREQEEA